MYVAVAGYRVAWRMKYATVKRGIWWDAHIELDGKESETAVGLAGHCETRKSRHQQPGE